MSSNATSKRSFKRSEGGKQRRVHRKARASAGNNAKRRALACIVVLALCLFLAFAVGDSNFKATPVGWVPFLSVLVAVILAFAYVQVLKRGLEAQDLSQVFDCRRGDASKLKVRLKNKTPLFYTRMQLCFYISDLFGNVASEISTTLSLAPFEDYECDFTARFDHVGTYSAGLSRIVVTDFLGLFSAQIDYPNRRAIQVTPRVVDLGTLELANDSELETTRPSKTVFSDSVDYAYVRDYVPGDPLKTIHWKLSARSENYLTRLFEESRSPGVAVVLDFYTKETRADKMMFMFDALVETAVSVCRCSQEMGLDTEMHFTDKAGEQQMLTSWDEDALGEIVSQLPQISADTRDAGAGLKLLNQQLNNQYGQNNLVAVTANLDAQIVSTMISAKMRQRTPLLFAIVPKDLEGRELDDWCATLRPLDEAGIVYRIVKSSDDLLKEVSGR